MSDTITLSGDRLDVVVSTLGAELQSIRDADGNDWLWDGDPAVWSGRAPILFPVVGRLAGDALRVDGTSYDLPKHGFARRRVFDVLAHERDRVRLVLQDDAKTRAAYPFPFRLEIGYAVAGDAMDMAATLHNPGDSPLPASFGFHPALRWPLPGTVARAEHRILFDEAEPAPIRRIADDGLLTDALHPSPVEDRVLALRDDLFADDALIFDRLASRSLTYEAIDGATVQVDFHGLPHLGIWTRPGARFLCIEPWQGYSDPHGFSGDFVDKPGIVMVAPGESRDFSMRMRFRPQRDEAATTLG